MYHRKPSRNSKNVYLPLTINQDFCRCQLSTKSSADSVNTTIYSHANFAPCTATPHRQSKKIHASWAAAQALATTSHARHFSVAYPPSKSDANAGGPHDRPP